MKPEYSKELLAEMWKKLNLAREFETRVQWLFSMGLVHGTTHLASERRPPPSAPF